MIIQKEAHKEMIQILKMSFPEKDICEIHYFPIEEKICIFCCPPGLCYKCGKSFTTFSPRTICEDCLWPNGFPILSFKWHKNLFLNSASRNAEGGR